MSYILQDEYNPRATLLFANYPFTAIGKTYTKRAQEFLASSSYALKRVGMRLSADSFPKTITMKLYDNSFSVLASKDVTISETGWAYVDFDSEVNISSGSSYSVGVDAPGSGYVGVAYNNTVEAAYADGNHWIYNSTDALWVEGPAVNDSPLRTYSQYVFSPPTPSGLNAMKTIKRLVCAAANKIWYES